MFASKNSTVGMAIQLRVSLRVSNVGQSVKKRGAVMISGNALHDIQDGGNYYLV